MLKKVHVSRDIMGIIAYICMEMGVDGHRADIAILKTSKTIAAYQNLDDVTIDHVEEAALLVLGERVHKSSQNKNKINQMVTKSSWKIFLRKKRKQEEQQQNSDGKNNDQMNDQKGDDQGSETNQKPGNQKEKPENPQKGESGEDSRKPKGQEDNNTQNPDEQSSESSDNNSNTIEKGKKLKSLEKEEDINSCEEGLDIKKLLKIKGKKKRKLYGKRVDSTTQKGKYVKSRLSRDLKNDIAIDATLRAAAMSSEGRISVKSEDITT